MRTMRLSLVGTVILMLLTGPVAVGQSPAAPTDPMAPNGAEIQITDFGSFSFGAEQPGDGVTHELGRKVTMTWESSDPRLSGAVTYDGNRDIFSGNLDVGLAVGTEMYAIENEGGRWVGQAIGWAIPDESGTTYRVAGDVIPFRGEGGYEGLSVVVHIDWVDETIDAVIFPGEMPPAPEPGPAD
jgi:hypothetical protein